MRACVYVHLRLEIVSSTRMESLLSGFSDGCRSDDPRDICASPDLCLAAENM